MATIHTGLSAKDLDHVKSTTVFQVDPWETVRVKFRPEGVNAHGGSKTIEFDCVSALAGWRW